MNITQYDRTVLWDINHQHLKFLLPTLGTQWYRNLSNMWSKNSRLVTISNDLKSLLLEIKANNSVESEFVLPRLQAWTRGEQAKVLREFCLSAGITSVKFHDLRATFITNMLAQGVALVKVMAIVGHKQMETTDVYLRLAGVEIKGATESLGYTVPKEQDKNNVIAVNFGKK